ncbi:MAG: hypothetical protein HUJ65_04220, partial [Oscillospiraceae bacterium]|nr:hypothetical protein [Oscillospiraceae bacterium]
VLIDKLSSLYPVDIFTVHDDWGTAKDAFFSPAMMEELLYEPTKRIIDHVHDLGKLYTFHCCGKIDRFMPAFAELGPNLTQIQRNINDVPSYKKTYGCSFGFNAPLEGLVPGKSYTEEELVDIVRKNVDLYAPGGGYSPGVYGVSPRDMWIIASELYAYSREFYENNK